MLCALISRVALFFVAASCLQLIVGQVLGELDLQRALGLRNDVKLLSRYSAFEPLVTLSQTRRLRSS